MNNDWKCIIKKRLCLVIPSLQAGGMERVMSELAKYFASKEQLEVHLILYGITREVFYSIPDSIIIHEPGFRFNNRLRFFYTVRTLFYLRSSIKRIQPETILSFGEYWNSLVLLALTGRRIPVYVSDRCQPDKSLGFIHDSLRRILYPGAAGIIAQTEEAAKIYSESKLHHNIRVIGNPIQSVSGTGYVPRENLVLTVGRLIRTKHHDKLIELFLRISEPGWKLVIVGYDHLKQSNSNQLRKIISENEAEDKVILAGKQVDVTSYYLRSKIFAFTSSSEGFPNVIGEAMAAGLPVVAFDCLAGPSEMIDDSRNGFLVPLFNYEIFRARLQLLMEDNKLRETLGEQAKHDILKFSVDNIGEKFLRFMSLEKEITKQ